MTAFFFERRKVIFEVFPAEGRKAEYLERAASLKSELECVDGFISVERFQSLTDPDKLLSGKSCFVVLYLA